MRIVEIVSVLSLLVICSITDIKEKVIYWRVCLLYIAIGVLNLILTYDNWRILLVSGLIPGVMIYFISVISREGIGKGDAAIFMCIGEWLGAVKSIEILIIALVCTSIISLPVIVINNKSIKTKVPFVPFVTMAFIIVNFLEMV